MLCKQDKADVDFFSCGVLVLVNLVYLELKGDDNFIMVIVHYCDFSVNFQCHVIK